MEMNLNYAGMPADHKLVRKIVKIIKEKEASEKAGQRGRISQSKYTAISRDGDTLEIGADHYARQGV